MSRVPDRVDGVYSFKGVRVYGKAFEGRGLQGTAPAMKLLEVLDCPPLGAVSACCMSIPKSHQCQYSLNQQFWLPLLSFLSFCVVSPHSVCSLRHDAELNSTIVNGSDGKLGNHRTAGFSRFQYLFLPPLPNDGHPQLDRLVDSNY